MANVTVKPIFMKSLTKVNAKSAIIHVRNAIIIIQRIIALNAQKILLESWIKLNVNAKSIFLRQTKQIAKNAISLAIIALMRVINVYLATKISIEF